jgi:hypothetical protein
VHEEGFEEGFAVAFHEIVCVEEDGIDFFAFATEAMLGRFDDI